MAANNPNGKITDGMVIESNPEPSLIERMQANGKPWCFALRPFYREGAMVWQLVVIVQGEEGYQDIATPEGLPLIHRNPDEAEAVRDRFNALLKVSKEDAALWLIHSFGKWDLPDDDDDENTDFDVD